LVHLSVIDQIDSDGFREPDQPAYTESTGLETLQTECSTDSHVAAVASSESALLKPGMATNRHL
jgi:hypothetical protein